MGVVAHVSHLHLGDLVDAGPVVAVVVDRRHDEHRVEHRRESLAAAHQGGQPIDVVEHRPGVVPGVALGVGVAPLVGAERLLERAVLVAAAHQARLGIEQVAVVLRPREPFLLLFGRAAQFRGHLCDAPVIVGVLERTGDVFVDADVVGNITQRVVVLMPQTARRAHRRVHLVGSRRHRLVERLDILLGRHALEDGIRNDRRRVVAHHAAAVSGRGPFGQEAALAVGVGQTGLDLGIDRRIDQVEQREERTEGIPEARIGIHVAREHLAVVGAVVYDLAVGRHLIELAGEEHRTVETRIEGAVLVDAAALDLDGTQHLVPALAGLLLHPIEVHVTQLLEILESLLARDERRGDADVHLLAARGREVHLGHGVVTLDRLAALGVEHLAAGFVGSRRVGQLEAAEGLVEGHHEIVAEVLGHTAAVARSVSGDGAVVDHLDCRPAVEGIDHHPALAALGEGEAHDGGTLGRRNLGLDVVVGQVDRIVIGLGRLRLVREPALPRLLVQLVVPAHGHHRELSVVVDPRRRLVRLFQAAERVRPVGVGPAVAHLARLGRPEVHAPRQSDGRIGVARRKGEIGLRTHQSRHILRGRQQGFGLRTFRAGRRKHRQGCDRCEFFHLFQLTIYVVCLRFHSSDAAIPGKGPSRRRVSAVYPTVYQQTGSGPISKRRQPPAITSR